MTQSQSPILVPSPAVRRVETAAWRTLTLCQELLDLRHLPLPIPVDTWIENPLGFRFGVEDLGPGVLGGAMIKEKAIVVSDRIRNEGRFRFTCAHELGHQVLHQDATRTFHDHALMRSRRSKTVEWEADRFAAAFLMPVPLVVQHLFVIIHELGLAAEHISELMLPGQRAFNLWSDHFLPAITSRFGVSKSTAVFRFDEIVLTDGLPFLLPEHKARLLTSRPRPVRRENAQPSLFRQ